jgi:hypothetical protein
MDISIATEFGSKTYDLADLPQDVMKDLGIPVDDPFDRLFPPGLVAPSIKVAPIAYIGSDGFIDLEALTLMWKKAVAEKKRRYARLIGPSPDSPAQDPFAPSPEFSGGFSISEMPTDVMDAAAPLADSGNANGNTAPQPPSLLDVLDAAAPPTDNQAGGPSHSFAGPTALAADAQATTKPAATQPAYSLFDAIEESGGANPSADTKIREAAVALGAAFGELKASDQMATEIFVKTQLGILSQLETDLPAEFNDQKNWLANLVEDFIRPLANSLDERARGVAITDSGWEQFFAALDKGTLNYHLPDISELETAKAMALNHINNDLRKSLEKNGVGSDALWSYIGNIVNRQTELVLKSSTEVDAM